MSELGSQQILSPETSVNQDKIFGTLEIDQIDNNLRSVYIWKIAEFWVIMESVVL